MMKLTKTMLSVFIAASFAAGSLNVSAMGGAETVGATTPSAVKRMKIRAIENVTRAAHVSSTRVLVR